MMHNSTDQTMTGRRARPARPGARSKTTALLTALFAVVVLIILNTGCASTSAHQKEGLKFFHAGEYDKSIEALEKAQKEKPGRDTELLLFRAKLNSYFFHIARARTLRKNNKKEEALKEYQIALNVFPDNKKLTEEIKLYKDGGTSKPKPFSTTISPPVTLNVDANEKMSVKLTNTPITKIFKVVGKSYGINFIFDKDFRDFVYSIDIESIGFFDILNQLCLVGNAKHRVMGPSSILIYPNTTFKKRTFSLRGVKVFYLSNIKAEDAKKMLMNVFRDQQILAQEDANLNSLIIKAGYSTLVEIERFIYSIDKRRSEVVIDMEILEVTKSFVNALGLNYADKVTNSLSSLTIKNEAADDAGSFRFKDLDKSVFFLTLPSAALTFLQTDDNSRIISRPNLRGMDGEEIKFMVGDEVPVPQTTLQSLVPGSNVANQPLTTYQYKNVGVDVKLTPYIHRNNEITLKMKFTVNSIAGYEGNFPIFGKREVENIIRLKEGETNIIGGFIKDEMREGSLGLPALSKIPIIGALFGSKGKNIKQTDLIFSITPRVVRKMAITPHDKKTIWSDVQENTGGGGPSAAAAPPPGGRSQHQRGGNRIQITPVKRRFPAGRASFFSIRLNSTKDIASVSVSGTVSGGDAVIQDLKPGSFGSKVDVYKNVSDTSFTLGFTFQGKGVRNTNLAQLKVMFKTEGDYTINVNAVSAMTKDNQPIDLQGSTAEIEIKGKAGVNPMTRGRNRGGESQEDR